MVPDRSNTASTRTDYSSTDTAPDVIRIGRVFSRSLTALSHSFEALGIAFAETRPPCLVRLRQEQVLIEEIRQQKKHAAQWILRIGMRLRFDPPDLMPVTKRAHYWKVLRCNRFGIGLRMGEAK